LKLPLILVCSIKKLERELQDAGTSGRKNLPDCRISDAIVRLTEVDIIEKVEELRPKLQREAFPDLGVFYDPEIGIKGAGPAQDVLAGVPKVPTAFGVKTAGLKYSWIN